MGLTSLSAPRNRTYLALVGLACCVFPVPSASAERSCWSTANSCNYNDAASGSLGEKLVKIERRTANGCLMSYFYNGKELFDRRPFACSESKGLYSINYAGCTQQFAVSYGDGGQRRVLRPIKMSGACTESQLRSFDRLKVTGHSEVFRRYPDK